MKKTLVALAALAATGAFAQSTVTLYGKIDAHIQSATQTTGGTDTAAGNVGLQVNSAGLSGSRFGFKGTEDLGGGMSAMFQLENGFNVDAGSAAQGGLLFGRQAYVGLAGGFGSLTLGRQYSPLDTVWGTYDAQGYTTNSAMNYAWNKGLHAEPGRINNSILYSAPAMGGFGAQLMYAPGEDKNPVTGQNASAYAGALVGYAAGPVGVHVGYESIGATAAAGVSTSVNDLVIAASYDLGVAKLTAGYQRASAPAGDENGWMIGAVIPAGAVTVSLGYARENNKVTGLAVDGQSSAFGGQVVYPLSKRTNVYADFMRGTTKAAAAAAGAAETVNTLIGAGVRHDF